MKSAQEGFLINICYLKHIARKFMVVSLVLTVTVILHETTCYLKWCFQETFKWTWTAWCV